jgi:hypothetical protein
MEHSRVRVRNKEPNKLYTVKGTYSDKGMKHITRGVSSPIHGII